MKAFCIPEVGKAHQIELMGVPVPGINTDEALVEVRAIGVGGHDRWAIPGDARFPYVIGLEASGVVVKVGSEVTAYKQGDRVMIVGIHEKGGTWAEFVAVSEKMLIPMPEGLNFTEAAALPVAGTTALEAVKALQLDAGNSLFVAGASGAIGTLAVQIAASNDYNIAASASPKNHEYLRSLGADIAIDYHDPEWKNRVLDWMPGGVDAALAIQVGTGVPSLDVVRDGGRLVTVSGDQVVPQRGVRIEQVIVKSERHLDLFELASQVASGRIRVVIEHVYPFQDAMTALEKVETRHAQGKIVLTMGNY